MSTGEKADGRRQRGSLSLHGALLVPTAPPSSERELLARARSLAGRTAGELATALGRSLPTTTLRGKGSVGALVDHLLTGGRAPSAGPDLPALGVEIKTLPLDARGLPTESTFVCGAQLAELPELEWERSPVRRKLARVLFVPVEGHGMLCDRRIGLGFFWSPSAEQEALLRADYEQLAAEVARGEQAQLVAHLGAGLQLRPKAPNARALTRACDEHGAPLRVAPRGFYLRRAFTSVLVQRCGEHAQVLL